jgi:uncharacterized iron-regulated membrane protein
VRKIHRWLSVIAALFLLVVASTGVLLQVQKLTGGDEEHEREHGERSSAFTTARAPADYDAMLARTLAAVRARAPDAAVASIELRLAGDEPQGVVTMPGEPGRQIIVDARDGRVVRDEPHEGDSLLLRIHSGEIFGEPGVVLGILWGLALVTLSITGLAVYLGMYAKRRKAQGKGRVFW